ncbi:MAG: pitrilysin family protein [Clostridiales bacterium]|nr:pitrilysin family protein [Clostridiales bacterium]
MYIFKTLSNGIRVVAERIDYLKSVSIGVWVGNGSRHEDLDKNGISHFIEHMVFKGTKTRSAQDIAGAIDAVGGQLNAFTAREYTCFYTKTLDSHADIAIDILSDMIFSPALKEEDMEMEKRVIGEEISLYEDSPEDLVYDLLSGAVWGDTPMGRNILGTRESLAGITPQIMRDYMHTHYTNKNMIISVSGNFGEDFFDGLEKYFGSREIPENEVLCPGAEYVPSDIVREKDIEQVQLVACFKGIDIMDEDVYSLLVFNNVFGSGMSSRLFQNIRERRGLAYSVCAGHSSYIGTGTFDISAGMSRENVGAVCALIAEEVRRAKKDRLSADEVARAKEQLKGSYILSYESTGARMQSAGRSLLLDRPIYTQEEVLEKIEEVNTESVSRVIDKVLDTDTLSVAAVGPINSVSGLFDF